jgi:GNAT superfamily N-acetyltransferase/anti-sigma regulatory factor (Ser/Thr protein kinase)
MMNTLTDITMRTSGLPWVRLSVPAHQYAIGPVQAALTQQARAWGYNNDAVLRMELAVEEAILTILRLTWGDDAGTMTAPSAGTYDIAIHITNRTLQLRITDYDLPYDLSMVPVFSPANPDQVDDNSAGLSAYLLHSMVDVMRVTTPGQSGQSVELEWYLPRDVHQSATPTAATPDKQAVTSVSIRPLANDDAIHLARLMYRNYGYSYVNPDMYIADRIIARCNDGRLTPWVAISEDNELVGHFALMKSHADAAIVEVGAAAVAPHAQGAGIFGKLFDTLEEALQQRDELVSCVHAVTCHPYTQKAILRHNYQPCALMLGYVPANLQFRSVHDQKADERGSVYYSCKLLKPMSPLSVYIPQACVDMVKLVADAIGMPLIPMAHTICNSNAVHHPDTHPVYTVSTEPALNTAWIELHNWSADAETVLKRQLRSLCRERFDVIYLSLDLTQPFVPQAWDTLTEMGFIPSGLTPYLPFPATFLLQYLNNTLVSYDAVHAVGEAAQAIKDSAFAHYARQELLA